MVFPFYFNSIGCCWVFPPPSDARVLPSDASVDVYDDLGAWIVRAMVGVDGDLIGQLPWSAFLF